VRATKRRDEEIYIWEMEREARARAPTHKHTHIIHPESSNPDFLYISPSSLPNFFISSYQLSHIPLQRKAFPLHNEQIADLFFCT
jgi:hypothetical protein